MRLSTILATGALFASSLVAQNASVTVIHGIPGLASSVDVLANGSKLFRFDFGESKTLSLKAATYNLAVQLNGKTVLSGAAKVEANKNYSVIAHLKASSGIQLSVFENDTSVLKSGQSRVIVRHLANAPAVDVGVDQNGKRFATFKNLTNPNQVKADVPMGAYVANIFAAGTSTKAFGPANLNLKSGTGYAVYAIGDLAKKTFRLFIQTWDLQVESAVTVIHGIPGLAKPVDVFANGSKLFSFDFGASKELMLKPATYNLEVKLNGTTVLSGKAQVGSGGNYSVIAHLKETSGIQLSVFENDNKPVNMNQARLIVRHTAKAPAVDVSLDQFGRRLALIKNLKNPASATVEVPAGNYESSLFVAGTSTKAFGPAKLSLKGGMSYVVYAIGDVSGKSFRLFVQNYGVMQFPTIKTEIGGMACAGRMWISNPTPMFGEQFDVQLFNGVGNDVAALAIGLRNLNAPLPAGCRLYAEPSIIISFMTKWNGQATARVVVPRELGRDLPDVYLQWGFPATAHGNQLRTTDYLKISK